MPTNVLRVLQVGMSSDYGGTEAVVYEIYRNIDKSRFQFDFLNVYDKPIARQALLESMDARILPLKLKRREGYRKYLRGIKAFYKEHAHEFDVVVCNVQCLDQIAMAKYAKKNGIPKTIIHLHNANYGVQPSRLARIAIFWNKRFCHRYVDQFVACSSLAAKWGYSKRDYINCSILKQGIDVERMRYDTEKRQSFRMRFGYSAGDRLYGSVGRMDPQKNQLFLIDVYSEIRRIDKQAKFVLVGSGPMEDEVRQKIDSSPIADRICVIPRADEIETFYSGIDCFLLPSKFEGLGMVLIEAQCSGLPCLATKDTIPPEAKLRDDFRFLPLDLGPVEWAKEAMKTSSDSQRDIAYHCIIDDGRDIVETAKEYSKILLS